MAILGSRDTASLVNMTGWDTSELNRLTLADNVPFEQVVSELNMALSALNGELAADPLLSSLVSFTDKPTVSYRTGTGSSMSRMTEYAYNDPNHVEREGHMLPLINWSEDLGWTWLYLDQNADIEAIRDDIRNGIDAVRDRIRIQLLSRLIVRADDTGTAKGLGASGISPGFATAAASTGVDFTPKSFAGTDFDSDHEHYHPDAGDYDVALFRAVKDHLREHGHNPPYTYLASSSDAGTIKDLTGFEPVSSSLVAYGNNTSLAILPTEVNSTAYRIGTIEDFDVIIQPGMNATYGFGYKSYGANSSRNPLAMRLRKGASTPQATVMANPNAAATYPLTGAMLYLPMGIGVKDRTNGVAVHTGNATWEEPTIS
jgi:hypothetical protein